MGLSVSVLFSVIIELEVENSLFQNFLVMYWGEWTIIAQFSRPGLPLSYCISCLGYQSKERQVKVPSPVDQLLPISEMLVQNVEKTLRDIVQTTIERSLFKFPTLKQAVEAKVVNQIFEKKRDQTIQFIRQFLEMQKKSIDVVFAAVPTPGEISHWESFSVMKDGIKYQNHPCMTSRTMKEMKDLAGKLYPGQLVNEIEGHGKSSAHTSFVTSKVSSHYRRVLQGGIFPGRGERLPS